MTFWGIAALVCAATAVLFSNLSTVLPANWTTGLHATRLEGGNLNLLRTQVAALEEEITSIRNENSRLMTMVTLAGQDRNEVTRRIGAIESTLPLLIENNNASGPAIDRELLTSGIGEDEGRQFVEAEGGSVAYTVEPLNNANPQLLQPGQMAPEVQEIPQVATTGNAVTTPRIITAPPSSFGVALGPQVTVQDAFIAWKDITTKAGPLLLGLGPLLSGNAGAEQQRLVAGPINDYTQAEQICVRMIRMGISCLPVPYAGHKLPE